LVTTQSLKRWMRFVLGLLLSWGLEGVLHDLTFCAYMKDLLGGKKLKQKIFRGTNKIKLPNVVPGMLYM